MTIISNGDRASSIPTQVFLASAILSIGTPGCGDDSSPGTGTGSATFGTSTGTDSGTGGGAGMESSADGADSTGGVPVPNPPTDPACISAPNTPISGGPFVAAEPVEFAHPLPADQELTICPGVEMDAIQNGILSVRVYRPQPVGSPAGTWPAGPLPVVIHQHGFGQTYANYDYIGNRLAEEGYIFLSIGVGTTADQAEEAMACAMSWIGSTEAEGGSALFTDSSGQPRIRCDVTIMGASQGGGAAWAFVARREEEQWEPYWFDFEPAALIGLAPTDRTLPADLAVATLLFGAGFDGDTGVPVKTYDQSPTEEEQFAVSPPKILVWVQDAVHDSFGGQLGGPPGGPSADAGAGSAAVAEYLPRFLQWQVENENVAENRRVLHGEQYPEPLNDPGHHELADSYRDCGAIGAQVQCDDRFGCQWDAAASPSPACVDECVALGTPGDCAATPGCVEWDGGCVPSPAIYHAYTLDTTTGAERIVVDQFVNPYEGVIGGTLNGGGQVSVGDVLTEFMPLFAGVGTNHETSAVLVRWGQSLPVPEGTITLSDLAVPESAATASHLSFRAANLVTSSDCGTGDRSPVNMAVRLHSEDEEPGADPTYVAVDPIPTQRTFSPPFGGNCSEQAMTTFRVPMSAFCADGVVDTSMISEIEFLFEDENVPGNVILDSFEFTRHTMDAVDVQSGTLNVCPQFSGVYACAAGVGLAAVQTACRGEPAAGACRPGDLVTSNAPLPEVFDGSGNIDGWLVHIGTGIIDDPMAPTASELTYIQERCERACEDEWVDDPSIIANCGDPGSLATATLVSTPSLGARRAIAAARTDGSGIFPGQSLGCSLLDDCCQAFDEDLCTASPERVTPQAQPVGTQEEYRISVDETVSLVESTSGMTNDTASLSGEVGYSFCQGGNASSACPFYLGSLHLESAVELSVDLECPGGAIETTKIEGLQVDLAQPAMGIAESGSNNVAFPAHGLVFDARFTVGSQDLLVRGLSEVDVVFQADSATFDALDIPFHGEALCSSGEQGVVRGSFDLSLDISRAGTLASPPSIDITMPTVMNCGDRAVFSASVSDPDGDLDSTRWYIDDVLMDASVTEVVFSEGHTVRAVARDARGASSTDEVAISCN